MQKSMATLKCLTISIITTVMVGLVLCWYAFVVEMTKELDEKYEALCDISEHMSCSRVFMSRYGKGFGLIGLIVGDDSAWNQPNPIFGAALYIAILMMTQCHTSRWALTQVVLCAIINAGSLYLACILYFVLHDFCVVCVSTYLVNLVLLLLAWKRYRILLFIEINNPPPRGKKVQ
ncbi:UNVERIFIED_CONTAM: hypothetical protein B566_EDAN019262 [Ephemera danica]|nr:hypothetical protein B566_EDAN019262 [Ephemera danica]